jgi:hypothetical protein
LLNKSRTPALVGVRKSTFSVVVSSRVLVVRVREAKNKKTKKQNKNSKIPTLGC